ncbi:MAG: hypothetical protein WCI95_02375 [bacterium]
MKHFVGIDYPPDQAAKVAVTTVREYQTGYQIDVTFCCFTEADLKRYCMLLGGQ